MMNFKIPDLKELIFSTTLDVRIYDLNYGNHLGHDSLASFFHEARSKFFRNIGYTEVDVCGLTILVKNLAINYANEAFHLDKILIKIGLGIIRHASVQLLYQATNLSRMNETGTAITNIVFYDRNKSRLSKVPTEFILAIKQDTNTS